MNHSISEDISPESTPKDTDSVQVPEEMAADRIPLSDAECIKLAHKAMLDAGDWERLTGIGRMRGRPYEITEKYVKFVPWEDEFIESFPLKEATEMRKQNEVAPLYFPCLPIELLRFIDEAPDFGLFEVPNAFREAVLAPAKSKAKASKIASDAHSHDWKENARQIADELYDHDTHMKCRDSLKGYAARVMDEMQARGIHSPRGPIDNPNTIQREALQGNAWWKKKITSMARGKREMP